jgi:hypothetical protein
MIAEFHSHLDDCRQCREHPFDLCAVGNKLLTHAGEEAHRIAAEVFDPNVSDMEYFLSRKKHHEEKARA